MIKQLHRRHRYDFFTIWGNGLKHVEDILSIIRKEPNIEIIRIKSYKIKDIKKFVFKLYACDPVPVEHLRSKLAYLLKVPNQFVIVFVKNMNPQENYHGEGPFRHIQCNYVNDIKWRIRELYNPKKEGQRTEEHVIHASDYEEQVDYLLKMLGHKNGLMFLHGDGDGLPFSKPYHLRKPDFYTFRTIKHTNLRAIILSESPKNSNVPLKKTAKISKTPHFLSLIHRSMDYQNYLNRYRYTWLTDDHYPIKLQNMSEMSRKQLDHLDPIIVIRKGSSFQILDGVHRAAVSLFVGRKSIKSVEFGYHE
jgi:hypothetical protein